MFNGFHDPPQTMEQRQQLEQRALSTRECLARCGETSLARCEVMRGGCHAVMWREERVDDDDDDNQMAYSIKRPVDHVDHVQPAWSSRPVTHPWMKLPK